MTSALSRHLIKDFHLPLISVAVLGLISLTDLRTIIIPSYLTIHSLFEVFSVTMCFMIFAFQWSIKDKKTKSSLRFLSSAFLSIGLYDLLHMLSYKGMPDLISPSGVEKAIYFWLAARTAQTLVFVMMAIWPNEETSLEKLYAKLGVSIVLSIGFSWTVLNYMPHLPRMFIPGEGLTPLKIQIEYVLIALSFAAGAIFYHQKIKGIEVDRNLFLANSSIMMGIAEFSLTLYSEHNDIYNFYGHLLTTGGFIYIYRGILSRELIRPYDEIDKLQNELKLGLQNFRSLETEYNRAKKMASLGAEVAHIAHDLNNVLAVINLNAQSIMRNHHDNEITLKKLDVIKNAVSTSSNFLRSLINYSNNAESVKSYVDVAQSLKEIHPLLNPLLGKNIKLNILSEAGVTVLSTPLEVHQIVLNLVVNARDAIGSAKGFIDISAGIKSFDFDVINGRFHIPAGEYSFIKVRDSGTGISPENLEKIFEPFFTTKEEGKGSGIGLATVSSIVSKNGGYLMVESELKRGTTFSIYFCRSNSIYAYPLDVNKKFFEKTA